MVPNAKDIETGSFISLPAHIRVTHMSGIKIDVCTPSYAQRWPVKRGRYGPIKTHPLFA